MPPVNQIGRLSARWTAGYTILALCIFAYFAVRFLQVIIGPVLPMVLDDFPVSRGNAGIMLTGMWVAYALAQLPSGVWADQYGARTVVLGALFVSVLSGVAMAVAPSILLFAIAVLALGLAAGAYYNPATTLLTKEFDEIGGVFGMHRIGGQVAGVIAPVAVAGLTVWVGWREPIGLGALLAVLALGLFVFASSSRSNPMTSTSESTVITLDPLRTFLGNRSFRTTTLMATLAEFVGLAAMAFLPIFLVEHYEFSVGLANILFAVFFGISAIAQPISGRLSDLFGRDATVALLGVFGLLGFGSLSLGQGLAIALPGVVLAGAALSIITVLQARMMDGLAVDDQGTGFGLFRTIYLLIGAAGTTVTGTAADLAGWGVSFGILATMWGLVVLTMVVITLIGRGGAHLSTDTED